ncbi:MAG: hypothetical protein DWH82_02790 [Planctomycetota bacterium]|nr:MAG: hypothetical protein DWH82_02790 [Planctomycetota bacterium]
MRVFGEFTGPDATRNMLFAKNDNLDHGNPPGILFLVIPAGMVHTVRAAIALQKKSPASA